MRILILIILLISLLGCNEAKRKAIISSNTLLLEKFIENNEDSKYGDEYINPNYVSNDISIINEAINKIADLEPKLSEFAKYCPGFEGWEFLPARQMGQINLGFDLKKSSDAFYGGYGSFYVDIIHFNDDIISVNITLSFSSQNQKFIKENIIKNITFPVKPYENGKLRFTKFYDKNLRKYQNETGYPVTIRNETSDDISSDENIMFNNLTNPNKWHSYDCNNYSCGCAGGVAARDDGRMSVDGLSKMKSYNLIEKAVFSANPVGRIYALEKLEGLEKVGKIVISDSTKQFIEKIKESDVPIDVCNYCPIRSYSGEYSYKNVKQKLDSLKKLRVSNEF